MTSTQPAVAAPLLPAVEASQRGQIRGSSLLLVGRLLAMGANFVIQVLIVRYLSMSDYGAFAYGLSLIVLLQSVLALGLDRADTRFLAIYDERGNFPGILGVLVLETAIILSLSVVTIALFLTVASWLFGGRVPTESARTVVLVLVCLAPITALDGMVVNAFTVFARPAAVFVRRYLLEPGFRLAAVAVVLLARLDVEALAVGYMIAGALGAGLYGALLVALLRRVRQRHGASSWSVQLRVREVLGFAFPLLLANLVTSAALALPPLVLGRYATLSQVAELRAVQPAAQLTLIVSNTFALLYAPNAARLVAHHDLAGLRALHWTTAAWVTVLTFPVSALMCVFPQPVTQALFGARYVHAAPYLAALTAGMFVQAATGFNGLTVQVVGRVKYLLGVNLSALAFALAANLVLVPPWGAAGAVTAAVATLLVHNMLKQWGLGRIGVGVWNREFSRVYVSVGIAAGALALVGGLVRPSLPVAVVLVAAASVIVLRACGAALRLTETFPELGRMPLLGRLLGGGP